MVSREHARLESREKSCLARLVSREVSFSQKPHRDLARRNSRKVIKLARSSIFKWARICAHRAGVNSLTPKSVLAGAKKIRKSETLNSTEGIQRGNSIQTSGRSALCHGDGTGKWMPVGMMMPSKVAFVRVTRDLPSTFLYTLGTTPPSFVVFGSIF